jgi:5-enolpyruvylshikimate-3-phosphate synthase
MLASVLSLHAGGRIRDADCVSKSNSGFFRDLAAMGGDIKLVQ